MYIYTFVYIHIYIYIYTYIHMYIYIYIYTCGGVQNQTSREQERPEVTQTKQEAIWAVAFN